MLQSAKKYMLQGNEQNQKNTNYDHRWGMPHPTFLLFPSILILALTTEIVLGTKGTNDLIIAYGGCVLLLILILRQDKLAALSILVIHLYVDWYLGQLLIAPILTGGLLLIFYLARSPQRPWANPRFLWLWGAFLLFSIYPALQGYTLSRFDAAFYYPNIIAGALLTFWLGTVLARNIASTRRFFQLLSSLGTLLAIITIVQDKTGILLFGNSRFDASLASTANFSLFQGGNVYRLASFFVNPDWNGTFFAILFCIPLGLLIDSKKLRSKGLYLVEACIILSALLVTYSVGAWISTGVGTVCFILLLGKMQYRLWIISFLVLLLAALTLFVPDQVALLWQHGTDPVVLSLRNGAWRTAINVIEAFPLTGIGLGLQIYMRSAEPYRDPEQYRQLAHPHNSYLELGAMAGLPVMLLFMALVLSALWLALRTWVQVDPEQRSLIGSGIAAVIALCVNSFSVNAWTLPPLAAFGWLILGVISSPLLFKAVKSQKQQLTERYSHA